MKILLIEDEKITRISLAETLEEEGFRVEVAATGAEGMEKIKAGRFDVVITDLRLPESSGIEILRLIRETSPQTFVIVITAYATVETAIEALKLGAFDYLTKPFSPDKLLTILGHIQRMLAIEHENRALKSKLQRIEDRSIIGNTPKMLHIKAAIQAVADNPYTVLIEGESGTGKELVARSLHRQSHRGNDPFVAINCAAIPESLLESELFGHEKGAFTGADRQHIGYFERAGRGTLFIDDIDDFPVNLQVKLLRVLQEKELTRVGGSKLIPFQARVVCASKVNLRDKVAEGSFREDLFYRLHIIPIQLPPLRERMEDLPTLLEHFFEKHGAKKLMSRLSHELLKQMHKHHWPGNIRELENFVERCIALSGINDWESLVLRTVTEGLSPTNVTIKPAEASLLENGLEMALAQQEEAFLKAALEKTNFNISKAAELLKLPRSTFRSKLAKFPKIKSILNEK
jgi:DNA-binding NtrC family response regulator